MSYLKSTGSFLSDVARVVDYVKNSIGGHISDTSLTSVTKLLRTEPVTVISQDLATTPELPDVLQTVTSVFAGYVMQAVEILSQGAKNAEVIRILDRINPDRDETGWLLENRARREAFESAVDVTKQDLKWRMPGFGMEAFGGGDSKAGGENVKQLYESTNLAVGKMIRVTLAVSDQDGKAHSVTLPVSVRLAPYLVGSETLSHIFTHRQSHDIVEQYYKWKAGSISWQDLLFGQNLIDEYRRASIKDKSGVLAEISRRTINNRNFGLLTNNPSLASASSIFVISKDEAVALESKTGKKLRDAHQRAEIFKAGAAMIIAVVDASDWEQVTFYYRDIDTSSTVSLASLKGAEKNAKKGPDVTDVMKSLMAGQAPTF